MDVMAKRSGEQPELARCLVMLLLNLTHVKSDVATLLQCRPEEELLEIQGTQLLSMTMGVKEYFQSEFDNVEAEIISTNKYLFPGTITFDDFLWVFGILRSRTFPKLYEDKLALIPFADLVNHSPDTTSEGPSWEIKEKGLFGREVMFSLRTPVDVIWRTVSPDSQSNESVSIDLSNREPKT